VPICATSCALATQPDGGGMPDLGAKPDLSSSLPDLATKADLAALPDLAATPDLSMSLPDLAHGAVDLGPIPCADLDGDGKPDCQETLLANARFDSDISSWTAEYGASASWQGAPDAIGGSASGAIVVSNLNVIATPGTSLAGASQCVPAVAGASYHVAAQVLNASGQGAGSAGLAIQFFPSADCSDSIAGAWSSPVTSTVGVWTVIASTVSAPAAAGSMRVRLVALKPFSAPVFQAHFDNVLLETP
jgi:hypothetical protein